jgi:hypothetical protein
MLYKNLELRGFRMKNRLLVLGILVMALTFGMAVIGCNYEGINKEETFLDDTFHPTDGRLTILGLDDYNGKFAWAEGYYLNNRLYASGSDAAAKINNDQVVLNVWVTGIGVDGQRKYFGYSGNSGNETVFFSVFIITTPNESSLSVGSVIVTFTNGVGTGDFVRAHW